jgi:ribosomal protein S27E
MAEEIIGRITSKESLKCVGCDNRHWVVSRTDDGQHWWLCPGCGRRWEYNPRGGDRNIHAFDPTTVVQS